VVADEVRNLAQRAAGAAKNTSSLIEGTIRKIKEDTALVERTNADFADVAGAMKKVNDLVAEISTASSDQSRRIMELSAAVGQMDKATQQNAANAEEMAASAEGLSTQADTLKKAVLDLSRLTGGKGRSRPAGVAAAPVIPESKWNPFKENGKITDCVAFAGAHAAEREGTDRVNDRISSF
jgi:methyl-accepting chemotaxis protein